VITVWLWIQVAFAIAAIPAACAAIDVAAQMITYAAAGHPPSLLFRRNTGGVMQLAENGLFIGPFPHTN
jgi:serine phosphatase RsbU (regulator of sigma subunit)